MWSFQSFTHTSCIRTYTKDESNLMDLRQRFTRLPIKPSMRTMTELSKESSAIRRFFKMLDPTGINLVPSALQTCMSLPAETVCSHGAQAQPSRALLLSYCISSQRKALSALFLLILLTSLGHSGWRLLRKGLCFTFLYSLTAILVKHAL